MRQIGTYPSIGSIASKVCGPRRGGIPAYVSVPEARNTGFRPGGFGGTYLGSQYAPFQTGGDPNAPDFKVNSLQNPEQLSIQRLDDRHHLRQHLDQVRRMMDASGELAAIDKFQAQAYELATSSEARRAFDISDEGDVSRDRYGRNTFGQSVLLARRLVEAGCTFVTIQFGGWDHHWNLRAALENYLPKVDMAISSLLHDFGDRGLAEKVLVVMCGEFGRTPRMNNGGDGGPPLSKGTPGRDHWNEAMFCFLAGGGVRGGQVVGATDDRGERPKDRPVSVGDLHATIYHVLGVDPRTHFLDRSGRPIAALDDGAVIAELF